MRFNVARRIFQFRSQKCPSLRFLHYESHLPQTFYNEDQIRMQKTLGRVIDTYINPNVDEWERNATFPAHDLFKKLGELGLLGVNKSADYGGMGLDYKYQAALLEEFGRINGGSIPMAFIIQTDQALPVLEKFGSHELKEQFMRPTIAGSVVACLGVTEPSGGSDVANIKAASTFQTLGRVN